MLVIWLLLTECNLPVNQQGWQRWSSIALWIIITIQRRQTSYSWSVMDHTLWRRNSTKEYLGHVIYVFCLVLCLCYILSVSFTCILSILCVCYWLNTHQEAERRTTYVLVLLTLSVLARCFWSILSLDMCFMAGGWARVLLAASDYMCNAKRLVAPRREDWSIGGCFILIVFLFFLFG